MVESEIAKCCTLNWWWFLFFKPFNILFGCIYFLDNHNSLWQHYSI